MKPPLTHFDYTVGQNPGVMETLGSFVQDRSGRVREEIRHRIGQSAVYLFACMIDYMRYGRQTFALGPHAQEMFAHTSLESVTLDMVRMPYPCVYIALKDCPWTIWGGPVTGYHRVAGFYVRETTKQFQVMVWGEENKKSRHVGDDATFWFTLSRQEVADLESIPGGIDLEGYLSDILSDPGSERDESDRDMGVTGQEAEAVMENQRVTARNIMRVALNLFLYLESDKADVVEDDSSLKERSELERKIKRVKSAKKTRRIQKQLNSTPNTKVTWVGNFMGGANSALPSEVERGRGGKVAGHIRRGHWHHYWTGPRKDAEGNPIRGTKLVRKWVPPVWVGGEPSATTRVYRLHGDDA